MNERANARTPGPTARNADTANMSKTNTKIATGENSTPGAATRDALAPQPAPNAPAFDAFDLELIERGAGAPAHLRDAARLLLELCGPAPEVGRFTLDDYAATGQEIGAMFRVCRVALDFLEADFLREVKRETAFYRAQVEAFEALLS